jgi:antitoxin VapB
MHLTVEDPEAERLAQEIAEATGQSMTHVVTEALRTLHAEMEKHKSATLAELREIVARSVALGPGDTTPHGDWLYDEFGLPK